MKRLCLAAGLLITAFMAHAQDADTSIKPVVYPAGFSAKLNVVYTRVNGWEGRMDVYLPPAANGASPVVLNIHGGGWNHGTKESQTGFNTFFKNGFAVVNIEYRLTGQATAPAAVEDVRCALIYVTRHVKEWNIDPNKIVVMGSSAGGHLALMAGLLGNDHRFDSNCKSTDTIKVAAIIDKYGIADVWDWAYGPNITSKSATRWLGDRASDEKFARSLSPNSYVSKNSPPTFIVHGDADPTVPYQQSVALHKQFEEAKVTTQFMTVPGGKHGGFPQDKNSELNQQIIVFLKQVGVVGNN